MAFSYDQILQSQYARLAEEHAQASAELEAGRVSEDAYRTSAAADTILALDQQRAALDARASSFVATHTQTRGNAYGLTRDELDIAHGMFSGDQRMTNEQRELTYAQNKERLRHARATGAYRDDQGRR